MLTHSKTANFVLLYFALSLGLLNFHYKDYFVLYLGMIVGESKDTQYNLVVV
jgi:hypothetical protein